MSDKFSLDRSLRRVSFFLVSYTILVILWGAWVRISHSGAGCGASWPLCHGEFIPKAQQTKTWIEYAHRLTSGLYGIWVIWIFFWIRRQNNVLESHRLWSRWVLIFMITEALLGAKLVLFKLVDVNDSIWRMGVMSLHQLNSFLLVAFTVRLWASSFERDQFLKIEFYYDNLLKEIKKNRQQIYRTIVFFLLLPMTGAWAALSSNLFPSVNLMEGLNNDFSQNSHFFLKIRILHPILGIVIGVMISTTYYKIANIVKSNSTSEISFNWDLSRFSLRISMIILTVMIVGVVTLLSLSPTSLKLTHLLFAHVIWAMMVFYYHLHAFLQGLKK